MLCLVLFFDALANLGRFAGALAQVKELCAAHNAVTNELDAPDARAVVGEGSLYAYAVGNTADGKALADAAALDLDDNAFKVLEALAVAFDNLYEYAYGVSDFQYGKVGANDGCEWPRTDAGPPAVGCRCRSNCR